MKPEWIEYTGSDEQIDEIANAEYGWIVRWMDGCESHQYYASDSVQFAEDQCGKFTHYLICQPHPYADMIIRQAQTGQPVWIRIKGDLPMNTLHEDDLVDMLTHKNTVVITTNKPNWHIPGAKYRLSPFEGEV